VGPKESCLLWAAEIWRFHYDQYRLQLIRLSRALGEKRPEYEQRHDKVILLHNNICHVAKVVKKYLRTFKWDVLPHPPYSPDIAPSDYWLFRRMQQVTGSLLSQKSKIGSKIGSSPKTSHFFEMEFENCLRDSDGQYFNWSVHSFCYEINAFLNTKKQTELICTPNTLINIWHKTCSNIAATFNVVYKFISVFVQFSVCMIYFVVSIRCTTLLPPFSYRWL